MLPFSGRHIVISNPPRCGGLAYIAPKGAEEKLVILLDIKFLMLMLFDRLFAYRA
ncbi:MAG: hypothetical protein LBL62_11635 [Planctomycetaceae bacterium]|jgi:hypothetical protein|nr:hypothetical protein [Planctomycetaceae bacterium]